MTAETEATEGLVRIRVPLDPAPGESVAGRLQVLADGGTILLGWADPRPS